METKSLKALARAIVERNHRGNLKETKKETMETEEDKYSNNNNKLDKVSISPLYKETGKPGNLETLKNLFDGLINYLDGCDLNPDDIFVLQTLAEEMDEHWNNLDYTKFTEVIERMLSVSGNHEIEEKTVSRPPWQRPDGSCRVCRTTGAWLSIHNVLVCFTCHPPAIPSLVKETRGNA